jgi:CRP-like cAMP-binding protein
MPDSNVQPLAMMLEKLQRRSTFTVNEAAALLGLPFRLAALNAASYIVREGDDPQYCCVILSGWAYRHKTARNGARQILAIHFKSELVGVNHGLLAAADHSIQTLSAADVAYISHDALLKVAAEFPNIAQALWRETLVEASVAREWIVNVGQRDARQRIAHLLCELVVRQNAGPVPASYSIDWPLTQEQLGDATGLTAVHVNRTVQRLRATGLISTNRRSVTILDWPALQQAGAFDQAYLHLPEAQPADMRQRPAPV